MADSDSDSVGSAAHARKPRKGADGTVAKLREQFEPSTSQAVTVVPARRSARRAASQPQTTDKRNRSPTEPEGKPRACFLAGCRLSYSHYDNFAGQN